jgi:ribosomal-protein-alanine N-acetyltransferase
LATEAGQAFLRFGFEQLGLSRIVATVQMDNEASVCVLEKLKLSRVGTQNGGKRSYYFYEITQQAWTASLVC